MTPGPPAGYRARVVDDELDDLLPHLAALALEGAKGVGKTATAASRAQTVYALDDPGLAEVVTAEPERVADGAEPILIDEWQRIPATWDVVRRAVDADPRPGRFLLTGSANPQTQTHSGAGRIVRLRMRPMTLVERGEPATVSLRKLLAGGQPKVSGASQVGLEGYVEHILSSGFPAIRRLSARARRTQLDGYLARIVDADFPEMGHRVRNPTALRRWMAAYAAATSTTASFETIRDAATSGHGDKPAKTTTQPYRDTLERLWVIDPVPAWSPTRNRIKELASAPKHQLADPALACRLLNVSAEVLLSGQDAGPPMPRGGTLLGALFESLVALNLRVYAQAAEAQVGHLRSHRGDREVDFVVTGPDSRSVAVEVKLSATVDDGDVRHLLWLRDQLGPDLVDAVVVTTGEYAYRRKDGVAVVPLALLGP